MIANRASLVAAGTMLAGALVLALACAPVKAAPIVPAPPPAGGSGSSVFATQVQGPAGTATAPGVAVGGTTDGWYDASSGHLCASTATSVIGLCVNGAFGYLGTGQASGLTLGGSIQTLEITRTGVPLASFSGFNAAATGPNLYLVKSRNTTPGSFTAVQSGDALGVLGAYGDDGTTYSSEGGEIRFGADNTVSTGVVPGNFKLNLATAAGTLQNDLCIDDAGAAWVGATGATTQLCSTGTKIWDRTGAHFGGAITTSGQITSTVTTGTAPLVVASTTNVANLNASSLGGATMAAPGAIGGTTPAAGAFTTLSATSQITSTLATGTAPFSIASTTNVANLNASTLGGATMAAPGAIGGTTPAAGTFTTVTANTSISLNGKLLASATAPTIANGGGLGTVGTITGSASAFDVTAGTGAASVFVITLPAATNGWVCQGSDITTHSTSVASINQTVGTNNTTTVTMGAYSDIDALAAVGTGDHLRISCSAY